ncbi:hypothetical protein [Sorangium sp. So ce1151]|uniref:hypothetical protein n=1 Tax=Sorangium sp. So ce1151 TaxID=3133332 RepID=UPI003F608144
MVRRAVAVVFLGLATALCSAACGGDDDSSAVSSGSAGSGGEDAPDGRCVKSCEEASDCCPAAAPDCASGSFPNNWTCDNNACRAPQCQSKEDCAAVGAPPNFDCLTANGNNVCVPTCTGDGDCEEGTSCTGISSSSTKFCKANTVSACINNMDCLGYGKCKDGACVCSSNADCTEPDADTCTN